MPNVAGAIRSRALALRDQDNATAAGCERSRDGKWLVAKRSVGGSDCDALNYASVVDAGVGKLARCVPDCRGDWLNVGTGVAVVGAGDRFKGGQRARRSLAPPNTGMAGVADAADAGGVGGGRLDQHDVADVPVVVDEISGGRTRLCGRAGVIFQFIVLHRERHWMRGG